MIAGEAPGPRGADRSGMPFVGDAAGRPVYRALAAAGMTTLPAALAAALATDSPIWDGARIAEAGDYPVLCGAALTNSYACCPTDDGIRFRAPRRRDEVLAAWNVARLDDELAEARRRGLRVFVALGRAADWAFGTHLGLRADPGVRYVALPHPSAQGLLCAAPDRGRGCRLADLAVAWERRLTAVLEAALR